MSGLTHSTRHISLIDDRRKLHTHTPVVSTLRSGIVWEKWDSPEEVFLIFDRTHASGVAVHHLLGQHFPPPPADVSVLPKSEMEATRTIRELLADHVSNTQCAIYHKHFDSLSLAMEGFDALGRARTQDSAGRPIDNRAELPNGTSAKGIPELIQYIEQHRKKEFIRTLNRKFLGYALGRSVKLSDEPLLAEMEAALKAHEYRFSALFEVIVRSPQFRKQRGRDFVSGGQP